MMLPDLVQSLSLDEFERIALLPENAARRLEYIAGRMVELVSNHESSRLGMYIGGRMSVVAEDNDLGFVTGADGGYRVNGERYIPDAAFISKTRQPVPSKLSYNPLAPDIAVEVLSPTDDPDDVRDKIVNYLIAGTVVWFVNPEKKHITIYAPGQNPHTLTITDTLEGGALLPGFSLLLRTLFNR
jgi:Uma2 family endonuclease